MHLTYAHAGSCDYALNRVVARVADLLRENMWARGGTMVFHPIMTWSDYLRERGLFDRYVTERPYRQLPFERRPALQMLRAILHTSATGV